MAKYMVLYNSIESAKEVMANATPEEMKAGMDEWIKWRDEAVKTVEFDFGMPMQAVSRVEIGGGVSESQSQISGYSFMEGEKDEILELLKNHPHLKSQGGYIDLLEVLPMPGM